MNTFKSTGGILSFRDYLEYYIVVILVKNVEEI
jgi:hypothetical protein